MRTWIPPTCGDSQRKEKLRIVLRADKGIAGKWDKQRIWQNSIHRLPQLKQVKLALFLETCCCYGFKTFFPASCLSSCGRFKEIGGGCIVRWRMKEKKPTKPPTKRPYHSLISFPKLWNRLQESCSSAIWRESAWCSLRHAGPLAGGSIPFHRTAAVIRSLLALRGRAGTGEGWQGSQGAESQEQGKGSGKTIKTDRVEEAGREFKESQPKRKAKAERYI